MGNHAITSCTHAYTTTSHTTLPLNHPLVTALLPRYAISCTSAGKEGEWGWKEGGGVWRRRGDRGVWGRNDEDTVVPGSLLLYALCTMYTAHHLSDYNTGTVGLMLAYLV